MAKAIETLSIKLDFKAGSGSQQIIDKIGKSIKDLKVTAGQTGPSIDKVRRSVNDFAKQGNRSISTIEGQVTALRALRREADINSKEFKELTADIAKYERQLNKAQGRRGGGARQATQVAGAVISGGIFGGPEGAIGGALGAFGGVQGAFAGAAIGAQVGNVRKSIGDAADYAAQIGKLKIALEGVAPNQNDFNSALETAAEATREFNVPQEAAVRGITRLTAAVTGAGGPVGDAETTFKNVTAAIKATGGSSEDVKGAITAMVQVFSKGKVSAEELSGQLGERLPGAVTLFAKANKMTLPELQKNLKAGTVGLNELMKFIEQLGIEFDGTARTIASSNEEAGARLSVAFDEMRASVGNSLLETGANFQDAFAEFITDLTPKVVTGIELIKGSVSGFMKVFLPAAAGITTFILLVKGAAIIATLGGIAAAIVTLALKIKILAAGLATVGILLATNPLFLGIAAVSGIVAGIVAIANATGSQADEVERLNKAVRESKAPVAAGSKDAAERFKQAQVRRGAVRQRLSNISRQLPALEVKAVSATKEEGSVASYAVTTLKNERKQLLKEKTELDTIIRETRPLLKSAQERARDRKATDYGDPSTEPGGTSGGAGPKDISEAMADKLIGANNLRRKGVQVTKESILAQQKLALEAAKSLLPQRQRVEINKINVKAANDILALEERNRKEAEQKLIKEQEKAAALNQIKLITGEITQEEFDQQEIRNQAFELIKLFPEQLERVKAALEEAASPLGQFKKGLKELFESAMDLKTTLGEVAVQAVNSFGDAFANFVTTGKANFADFTASILRDLAKIFARAALFKTLAMIPGVGNFLGLGAAKGAVTKGMTPPATIPGSVSAIAANGLAVARNGIVPYAKGGLVTKPTLFQYRQGGVGNYGLMGEAGTEAIMPLRRGANGKLGVEASGGASNVVVNVDASGSSVEGDSNQAAQLGKMLGAAVQAELVKQKRPGGLLAS